VKKSVGYSEPAGHGFKRIFTDKKIGQDNSSAVTGHGFSRAVSTSGFQPCRLPVVFFNKGF
jgi:hypothetical protein